MARTKTLKIENDEFHPTELKLDLGDEIEILIDGFVPVGQKYTILCSEFPNTTIYPGNKFKHKFEKTGEFLVTCKDFNWMFSKIFVITEEADTRNCESHAVELGIAKETPTIISINRNADKNDANLPKEHKNLAGNHKAAVKNSIKPSPDNKPHEKKKSKEKKNEQKFKRKLRSSKEHIEEISNLISEVCKFSRTNATEEVKLMQNLVFAKGKLTEFKLSIPAKFKEVILKLASSPLDENYFSKNQPDFIVSSTLKINLNPEPVHKFSSSLSIEKIEQMLEKRII